MRVLILIFLLSCDPPASSRCYDSAILAHAQSDQSNRIACSRTATVGFADTSHGVVLFCSCPKDVQ